MYGKSIVALAAIGAVNASPVLNVRQASSVASSAASAASSAVSSVASDVSSTVASSASGASSAVSSAASSAAPSSMMSSMMSSSAASTASSSAAAGEERFPAYPCPAGTLLTYAAVNQTFQVPITQLTQAAGEFATSPIFPNITQSEGGNSVGATHSFDLMGLNVSEVLVNVTTNSTSGSAIWNWNNTAPITISGIAGIEGLELANYSTVLQLYDPDFTTTGEIGNTSFANLFTNACFSNQEQGMAILSTLGNLELGNLATAVGSNSSMAGGETSMMSSMMPSSTMDSMMSSSTMMSAASSAASGAESATSAAASGASSAASGATSVAAEATSAVAGAASSAAAVATSSA